MAVDEFLLRDWLTDVAATGLLPLKFKLGPHIPEWSQADTVGVVTMLAGLGPTHNGTFDQPAFQVRVRSKSSLRAKLRSTMLTIDKELVQGVENAELWGTYVRLAGRTGGGPSPLEEDQHERISYVCTYFAQVEL